VKCLRLPPRSPNLNAFAERWVRSVKEECLSHLILFGERSSRKALMQFQEHYHEECNHQGKNNVLLFPAPAPLEPGRRRGIRCRERLGGLLRYYIAPHEYFEQTPIHRGFRAVHKTPKSEGGPICNTSNHLYGCIDAPGYAGMNSNIPVDHTPVVLFTTITITAPGRFIPLGETTLRKPFV